MALYAYDKVWAAYESYLLNLPKVVSAVHQTGQDGIVRSTRARPVIAGSAGLRKRNQNEQRQYELDVAMWCGALYKGNGTAWKRELIRRIFT